MKNSCILWEGNSLLNNEPIVVILTGLMIPSSNRKTGKMIQSWIILQNMHPFEAVKTQADEAICGHCPLRGDSCYVDLRPVFNLYRGYKNGKIPPYSDQAERLIKIFKLPLRLGAYGDSVAAPLEIWKPLLDVCTDWTGYTHQWRTCDPRWKEYLMASVESPEGAQLAHAAGWRTYRIIAPDDPIMHREIACPNSHDKSIQCDRCKLCSGSSGVNIAEVVHGAQWKIDRFLRQRSESSQVVN